MTDTNTAQMVVDLQANDEAVRANGWVAPGLGMPGAPLGLLESTLNPLGGLAAAGLSWFMPLVSFLGDGLTQLQGGNSASVSSGSQDFGAAGQDIGDLAGSYRASTSAQTSEWSGEAASSYRDTAAQHADGVAGLGQASTGMGSAIIGAGQVVAQCIAEVTELIAEAVSQIVPIMTQAMARAGETFGQSVAEAIPPCVGIAVEYALRIAAKLAALMASGDNLMKLVQGAMAIVGLIQQAMQGISQQSVRSDADPQSGGGGAQQSSGGGGASDRIKAAGEAGEGLGDSVSQPSSSMGNPGGALSPGEGAAMSDGSLLPAGSGLDTPTYSSSSAMPSIPQSHISMPDTSRAMGNVGGLSSGAGSAAPLGGLGGLSSVGAVGAGQSTGARVGTGRSGGDTVRQEGRTQPGSTGRGAMAGGVPFGAMGARGAGGEDKEHQRKYDLVQLHDEDFAVAPQVLTGGEDEH
jgi:hypothetical protein